VTVEQHSDRGISRVRRRQHAGLVDIATRPDGVELAVLPVSVPSVKRDIQLVRAPGYGVRASADAGYAGGQFNRDGAKVSRDYLARDPSIGVETVDSAVRSQGRRNNPQVDEHPGKYHHEHRSGTIIDNLRQQGAPKHIIDRSLQIMEELGAKWAWTPDRLGVTFYGAADTTPTIVNLIADIEEKHPQENILTRQVSRPTWQAEKPTEIVTVKESVTQAIGNIVEELFTSDLGLPEYTHENPRGIQNQYFKDSLTSLIFKDSQRHPNFREPIAEIGILGTTYDALHAANTLLTPEERDTICSKDQVALMFEKKHVQEVFTQDESTALLNSVEKGELTSFDVLGKIIQKQIIMRYWMPEENYFASALDRDPQSGDVRVIDSIGSNPAALLKSKVFDGLPMEEQEKYVGGIARMIMGAEFLTEAGHRGRALRHKNALKDPESGAVFDDYHGVKTVWPNEVSETIEGLLKWELYDSAEQLMNRHTNAINVTGAHEEFHYVDEQGRLGVTRLVHPPAESDGMAEMGETIVFNNSNHNEKAQAWAISSNYRVKQLRTELAKNKTTRVLAPEWQSQLDEEIVEGIEERGAKQEIFKTFAEIDAARQKPYSYYVDTDAGQAADSNIRAHWGYRPWFEEKAA